MRKLVVLKLDGDLEQGVRVTLEIGAEGERPSIEVTGQLPRATDLVKAIDQWQSAYCSFGNSFRIKAKKIVYGGSINQWREGCYNCAIELRKRLNNWLVSESFRPIREKWLQQLSPSDEVRVLIRTSSVQLRKLPWHLWDLIEDYRLAEVAFSAPESEQPASLKTPTYRDKVRILAILGNSAGINVQTDRQLLENLPDAATTFLVEPQRQNISNSLWNQPWDILFFAGHSNSEGDTGRIYINQTDSLTIKELSYALRNAVANGLQVAIFNSCDGLGLALELEQLHIGQIIVMREPVPDEVAQAFLTDFLAALASGKSFYLAEREAREKLHGLEDNFPCASWLPVIFQNPAAVPPSWQDLGRRSSRPIEGGQTLPRPQQPLLYRAIFKYSIILLVGVWIGKIVFDEFVPPKSCDLPATDVSDIDFSSDGKYLATASLDNTVRVLEVKGNSFKEVACQSHEDGVVAVKFSPDQRKIATASLDSTAGLMEITPNGSISSFKTLQHTNPFPVVALNFSTDGKYLATASADGRVHLWDTNSRNEIAVLRHKTYVRAVSFSRDGKYLATASLNNKAQVWEWQAHKYDQKAISLPSEDVVDVTFSPTNNNYLTTASADGTTQVWDMTSSSPKAIAHLNLNTYIINVSFSPDGKYVATTSSDNKAQVWNWQTHNSNDQKAISLPQDNVVAVAFSPTNGKYIAVASTDGTVEVWTTNGRSVKTFPNKGDPDKNSLVGIVFSPTDDNYLATASADGTVEIRNNNSPNN
ncbi:MULTISPECIES: CHAT domain-containing protein [Cyanophyceae]|uniref:CHAT domain-containing protein n=1 Tax=Cyanophyceae TaxID=3028117 RepID=UPI001686FE45|nr:CHAT domain-containing protein [Trichocoleus sp. FACHB-69]MBD1935658.1 CHAT domain-containing protein [Trichocoleus sp. FACHB-69]